MRTQLAALCVGELPHLQFRLHLHEELRQQLERGGQDLKVYLRDRLTRTLRESFNPVPQYLFVLEDLDVRGKEEVRPHTHGVIELPAIDVAAFEDGRTRARYRRVIQSLGLKTAQKMAGREALKIALKQATGNLERPRYVGGVDQASNVWTRESYNPLFNKEAISYAFKNADSTASSLPLNRLAKSAGLWAEAQRFWELVRKGEEAMPQWS